MNLIYSSFGLTIEWKRDILSDMAMLPKRHNRIGFVRPVAETMVIWLVMAVVAPTLLLSLLSFWAMRQQEQLSQQAAQHRAAVLLSEAEEQVQAELEQLRSRFSIYAEELSASAEVQTFSDFNSKEALIESLFLLNFEGDVLLPQPPPSPIPLEVPDSTEWQAAQRLEFTAGDLAEATKAYQAIASSDDRLAPHAINAVARCALRQRDFGAAQTSYTRLLQKALSVPTPLRLGAYHQLAQLKQRLGESQGAAGIATEGVEWIAEASSVDDYQTCVYYLHEMRGLWETIPQAAISDSIRKRWKNAQERWEERYAHYQFHSTLNETILPILWPSVAALSLDETRYFPVQTPHGWQVSLVMRLADGGYLGSILSLTDVRDKLLLPLNARLSRLEEGTEGRIITSADAGPEPALAVLRLAQPLSFWQLAAERRVEASPLTRWQARLIKWSVILCLVAILAGVYWTWRRVQSERELSRLRTDFVSNVSHELRTPLTSIRMFVETLVMKRYRDESEAEECLSILQREMGRLARLVDRVLDFSRMEQQRKQFDFAEGELQEVVEDTVQVFQGQMSEDEEECEIHTQIAEDVPPIIFDRDAISEVLWNLLHNAVKYSDPPRQVSVELQREVDKVTLTVHDNGIGIPKHEQKRVFERFYRANDTLTRVVEGSGLGLAMVKYIVEAHGGTVSVESQVGEGSTFAVILPIRRDTDGKHSAGGR